MSIKHAQGGDNFRTYLTKTNERTQCEKGASAIELFQVAGAPRNKKPILERGPSGSVAHYKRRDAR